MAEGQCQEAHPNNKSQLETIFENMQGERKGGIYPLPLLLAPPLQRGHLPQVLEQELQGHQPLALLHHVRGQDQHRSRLQFILRLCGNVIDTLKINKDLDIDLFCFK